MRTQLGKHVLEHGDKALPLTGAIHGSIFLVLAGTAVPGLGPAVPERPLRPSALHLLQPDGTRPLPKRSLPQGRHRGAAAQLPARNLSVLHVPGVVAHRPPGAAAPNLHSARAPVLSSHSTNLLHLWKRQKPPVTGAAGRAQPGKKGTRRSSYLCSL